jgi:phosphoribosyl-dephospho-CoA transferase
MPEPAVHSLLRIATQKALSWEDAGLDECAAPEWAALALQRLPFVVTRRNLPRPGGVPVGIRGSLRSQRAPAWLQLSAVQACVTPRMLAVRRDWRHRGGANCPAIAVLDEAEAILAANGFADSWGPGGSVGAELASDVQCTHANSDLDLVLYAECLPTQRAAKSLHAQLEVLTVRVDTLIETPQGGVALADLAAGADRLLLRTAQGPRLV